MDKNNQSKNIKYLALGVFILTLVSWFGSSYNGFVSMREQLETQWSNVEVQYQRRADLIPNLVATVEGAAGFEQETLTAVTEARTQWLNSTNPEERITAANNLDSTLARLLVSVEAYPTLTATENFQALQAQLEGTENRVAVERRRYNETVLPYNTKVQQFPGTFIARLFGFEQATTFESSAGSEVAPSVNFNQE